MLVDVVVDAVGLVVAVVVVVIDVVVDVVGLVVAVVVVVGVVVVVVVLPVLLPVEPSPLVFTFIRSLPTPNIAERFDFSWSTKPVPVVSLGVLSRVFTVVPTVV